MPGYRVALYYLDPEDVGMATDFRSLFKTEIETLEKYPERLYQAYLTGCKSYYRIRSYGYELKVLEQQTGKRMSQAKAAEYGLPSRTSLAREAEYALQDVNGILSEVVRVVSRIEFRLREEFPDLCMYPRMPVELRELVGKMIPKAIRRYLWLKDTAEVLKIELTYIVRAGTLVAASSSVEGFRENDVIERFRKHWGYRMPSKWNPDGYWKGYFSKLRGDHIRARKPKLSRDEKDRLIDATKETVARAKVAALMATYTDSVFRDNVYSLIVGIDIVVRHCKSGAIDKARRAYYDNVMEANKVITEALVILRENNFPVPDFYPEPYQFDRKAILTGEIDYPELPPGADLGYI